VQTLQVPDHLFPALQKMVVTLTKKGHDYSNSDEDWGSNFATTSDHFGMHPWEAADFNELQKLARLRALRRRPHGPRNESVEDSYLDKANFALLAYALYLLAYPPQQEFDLSNPEVTAAAKANLAHSAGAYGIPQRMTDTDAYARGPYQSGGRNEVHHATPEEQRILARREQTDHT
jgi:hypothetical protein